MSENGIYNSQKLQNSFERNKLKFTATEMIVDIYLIQSCSQFTFEPVRLEANNYTHLISSWNIEQYKCVQYIHHIELFRTKFKKDSAQLILNMFGLFELSLGGGAGNLNFFRCISSSLVNPWLHTKN
jgi:hypothetical protein